VDGVGAHAFQRRRGALREPLDGVLRQLVRDMKNTETDRTIFK